MMRNRLWAIAAGIIFCCTVACSCGTVPDTIATVNGKEISGEEYRRALNGFLANYGLTEESLNETMGVSEAVEYKNNIIDEMVLQELMLQYAASNGLAELSDDDKAEVTARAEEYLENLRTSFENEVESDGSIEQDEAQAEAERRYNDYVETYDYTQETLEDQFGRQVILDRVYDDVMKASDVTEAEVRAYYDKEVASEQERLKDADAQEAVEAYVEGQDDVQLYVAPAVAGAVRNVKHILLMLPDDVSEQIEQLEEAEDSEGAEQLRTAAMEELRQKAQEVADRAVAGEDFDTLTEEYNEDPGVAYNPDGYLVYEGASYDETFLDAALKLGNIGDITPEPVESSFGYHIIMYAGVPQTGAVPYEEVRDELEEELRSTRQSQLWREAVASWEEDADIQKHEFRAKQSGS